MQIIKLTQGREAWVSDCDFELVSKHKWYAWESSNGGWYAVTNVCQKMVFMHRLILNTPDGVEVDHRNHNGLDNRRFNIRNCAHIENGYNRRSHRGTSRYKGVSWLQSSHKWRAQITQNGKIEYLGCFDNEVDAAKKYNAAALKYHGRFACLNVITVPGETYSLFGA